MKTTMIFMTLMLTLALAGDAEKRLNNREGKPALPPCRDSVDNCRAHAEATCVGEFRAERFRTDCINVVVKLCSENKHNKLPNDFCQHSSSKKNKDCAKACGGITNRWKVCRRCCKKEMDERVCQPKCDPKRNFREAAPATEEPATQAAEPEPATTRQAREEQPALPPCRDSVDNCRAHAEATCVGEFRAERFRTDCINVVVKLCSENKHNKLPNDFCKHSSSKKNKDCAKACGGITNRWKVCRRCCKKEMDERVCQPKCDPKRNFREAAPATEEPATQAAEPEPATTRQAREEQPALPPCRDSVDNCRAHAKATCVGEFRAEKYRTDCINVVVKLCSENKHNKLPNDFCQRSSSKKNKECAKACGGITNRWKVCRSQCKKEMDERVCQPKCDPKRNFREAAPATEEPATQAAEPEPATTRQAREEQPAGPKCLMNVDQCDAEARAMCAGADARGTRYMVDCLAVHRSLCTRGEARNLPEDICKQSASRVRKHCGKACGGITNRWKVCRKVCGDLVKQRVCNPDCVNRNEREAEAATTKATTTTTKAATTEAATEPATTKAATEPATTKAAQPCAIQERTVTVKKPIGNPAAECAALARLFGVDAEAVEFDSKTEGLPAGSKNDVQFATQRVVHFVYVKAGTGGNAYYFPAGTTNGAGITLRSDKDVSHVTYCRATKATGCAAAPTEPATSQAVVLPDRLPCKNEAPAVCAARAPQMCKGSAKGFEECCAVFTELCSTGTLGVFPENLCEMPRNLHTKLCARACDGVANAECCATCEREISERLCAEKCGKKPREPPAPVTTQAETKPAVIEPTHKPFKPCENNDETDCNILATKLCGAADTRAEGICRESVSKCCQNPQPQQSCEAAAVLSCGEEDECALCRTAYTGLCKMSQHCKPATSATKAATTTQKVTLPLTTEKRPDPTTRSTTKPAPAATTTAVSVCAPKALATCMGQAQQECAGDRFCVKTYARFCTKPQVVPAATCLKFVGNACGVTSNSAACRKACFKQCLVHAKCPTTTAAAAATTQAAVPVSTTEKVAEPETQPPLTKPSSEGRCVGKKPQFCAAAAQRICGPGAAKDECRAVFIKHCLNPLPISRQLCAHQAKKECGTQACRQMHFKHCQKIAKCARAPFPCEAREHAVCERLSHRVCGFSDREAFCRKVFYTNCRQPKVVPRKNCATRASAQCGVTAMSGVCRKVAFRQCVLLSRCAPQCESNADCQAHPTNKCLTPTCLPNGKCQYRMKACSDNVPCTEDSCDAATGVCKHEVTPASHKVCDDKIACTSDSCTATGCVHTPVDDRCNDARECTSDKCHPATGCVNVPKADCEEDVTPGCASDAQCDDNIECTQNRCIEGKCDYSKKVECTPGCKPEECRCYHPLCKSNNDCEALNDAEKCRVARCDAKRGACVVNQEPCDKGCENDDAKCKAVSPGTCYQSACLSNGKCEHMFAPNDQECTTPCGNGKTCPEKPCKKGVCSAETGACVYEDIPNCTPTTVAQKQTTRPAGECTNHASCVSDSTDKCIVAQCDLNTKQCKNINVCQNGVCTAEMCDDNDPCTVDECSPQGCKHTNVCRGTKCVDKSQCDDQNPCTRDLCVPTAAAGESKCKHVYACAGENAADKCHTFECVVNPLSGATRCLKNKKYLKNPELYNDKECAECQTDKNCEKRNTDASKVGMCEDFKCKYVPKCTSDEQCTRVNGPCKVSKCNRYGKCVVQKARCDDDNECTLDRCIVEGTNFRCEHTPVKCPRALGATAAALDGQCDPKNGCGVCWVKDSCNDDNACTVDECVLPKGQKAGGKCVHTPIAGFNHRWYENLWCDPNVRVTREVLETQADRIVVEAQAQDFEVDSKAWKSARGVEAGVNANQVA